jgi:hypothetical protein
MDPSAKGTFMDPAAWDEYERTGAMSQPPPPQAPQPSSAWPQMSFGKASVSPSPSPNALAAVRTKIALGLPVDESEVAILTPEQQQELAQDVQRQSEQDYITGPVKVAGRPGQEEAVIPTTSAEQVDLPYNLPGQEEAWGQAARSKQQAITANYDAQKSMLEQALLQAREQRVELQASVEEQEQKLAFVDNAQREAIQEANNIQAAVREKRVDPSRIFRSPAGIFAAFAAVMADTMLGFQGKQQNSIQQLIETDTAAQEAEIMKLRGDADNAFKYALQTYDGDIEQARAALNIAKAEAAKNELSASAASMGLQQLPAQMLEAMAGVDAFIAENMAKMGQNARHKAEQSYKYQPYVAASYGYDRAPTYKEMASRSKDVADFQAERYRMGTGLYPKESATFESKRQAAERSLSSEEKKRFSSLAEKKQQISRVREVFAEWDDYVNEMKSRYGKVPGLQWSSGFVPGQVRAAWAEAGSQQAKDALRGQQIVQGAVNALVESQKGVATEGDLKRWVAQMRGQKTWDEVARGMSEGQRIVDKGEGIINAGYHDLLPKWEEIHRGETLRMEREKELTKGTPR